MRKIIHVDMDCFFAAVEMRDNPALRDIPIAIGGGPGTAGGGVWRQPRTTGGDQHRQLSRA